MNNEEKSQETALFSYSLVASAVTETFEDPSLAQHLRNVAVKEQRYPDGKMVNVSFHSLERWLYIYKRHYLIGITPRELGRERSGSRRRRQGYAAFQQGSRRA